MLGSILRAVSVSRALLATPALLACSSQALSTGGAASPAATASAPADADSLADAPDRGPWETCHSNLAPTGNAQADLSSLTRACGALGGMRPVSDVYVGQQDAADATETLSFQVPAAGKCYRAYAAAEGTVSDLNLIVRKPSGDSVVADLTRSSTAIVPEDNPVCFTSPGLYLLEVGVYRGSGRYALQLWGR